MPESSEQIPTSKNLKIHSIKLLPIEEYGGKKFGPWSEEDFPFRQHPILIACPERYFLYHLHVCVESAVELKNVFLEGMLLKSLPVEGVWKKFKFERKMLNSVKREGDKYYYYQFWQWPGAEKGDNYTFWRFPDRYTLSDCVFKNFFDPQNSPYPERSVNNEKTFNIDLL
jgi:hypothetical protein